MTKEAVLRATHELPKTVQQCIESFRKTNNDQRILCPAKLSLKNKGTYGDSRARGNAVNTTMCPSLKKLGMISVVKRRIKQQTWIWRSCAKSPGGGEHITELNKKLTLYNWKEGRKKKEKAAVRQEQKQNLSSGWPCGSRINTCSKAKSHPRNLSIDEQFSPATQVLSISKLNITVLTAIRAGTRACGLHRPLTPPPGTAAAGAPGAGRSAGRTRSSDRKGNAERGAERGAPGFPSH